MMLSVILLTVLMLQVKEARANFKLQVPHNLFRSGRCESLSEDECKLMAYWYGTPFGGSMIETRATSYPPGCYYLSRDNRYGYNYAESTAKCRWNKMCACKEAVDGKWGAWVNSGPCSKSCGGGIQQRSRACDNPAPANRGLPCSGGSKSTGTVSCNAQQCPDGAQDQWDHPIIDNAIEEAE